MVYSGLHNLTKLYGKARAPSAVKAEDKRRIPPLMEPSRNILTRMRNCGYACSHDEFWNRGVY